MSFALCEDVVSVMIPGVCDVRAIVDGVVVVCVVGVSVVVDHVDVVVGVDGICTVGVIMMCVDGVVGKII